MMLLFATTIVGGVTVGTGSTDSTIRSTGASNNDLKNVVNDHPCVGKERNNM